MLPHSSRQGTMGTNSAMRAAVSIELVRNRDSPIKWARLNTSCLAPTTAYRMISTFLTCRNPDFYNEVIGVRELAPILPWRFISRIEPSRRLRCSDLPLLVRESEVATVWQAIGRVKTASPHGCLGLRRGACLVTCRRHSTKSSGTERG